MAWLRWPWREKSSTGTPANGAATARAATRRTQRSSTRHESRSESLARGDKPSAAPRTASSATAAIPPEVLRQVRHIEMRTRGLVNSLFTGEYRSVFKGQGMEFSEVREYQPGDEVRTIDWNVTARMRRPFVKRYIEERELTVMLAVDLSGSERFGTRSRFKSELATELAAVLAMSAVRNNDRVGILLFTDRLEHVVPPAKGRRHALRVLRDLFVVDPEGTSTNMAVATEYLGKLLTHHSIVFILSDFLDPNIEAPLKRLAQRHDVVAVTIEDPAELALPDIGLARLADPESGETVDVDTSNASVRTAYAEQVAADRQARRTLLRRLAIDEVPISTDASYIEPLLRFFRTRETRGRRR
jgi:uncharacterized protein (DUF58 family)